MTDTNTKNTKTTDEVVRKIFEDYGPAIGDALTQSIRSNTATSDVDADLKASQEALAAAQTDLAVAQTVATLLTAYERAPLASERRTKIGTLIDRTLDAALDEDDDEDKDEDEDEPEAPEAP